MSQALSAFADDNRGKAGQSRLLWQSHKDSGHLLTNALFKPMGEGAHVRIRPHLTPPLAALLQSGDIRQIRSGLALLISRVTSGRMECGCVLEEYTVLEMLEELDVRLRLPRLKRNRKRRRRND